MEFLNYIEIIKKSSTKEQFVRGRKCYTIDNIYVSFWTNDNGEYLDGLQFLNKNDCLWNYSTPKEFVNTYINSKLLFREHSVRKYGEPKLPKPSGLKGINKTLSIDYIPKKARCQIFIKDNDIWIKHVDYFSPSLKVEPEDIGSPLKVLCEKYIVDSNRKAKFIYDDSWGDIVLKNEAWICIENLMIYKNIIHPTDLVNTLLTQQEKYSVFKFKELQLQDSTMSRFYENLLLELNQL